MAQVKAKEGCAVCVSVCVSVCVRGSVCVSVSVTVCLSVAVRLAHISMDGLSENDVSEKSSTDSTLFLSLIMSPDMSSISRVDSSFLVSFGSQKRGASAASDP